MGEKMKKTEQDLIFSNSESDNWFKRNKECIISKKADEDYCFNAIKTLPRLEEIQSVLELGSSNGYRLNFLKQILPNCKRFVGVDLSQEAVRDGRERYNLDMQVNSITGYKVKEKFDMVIVNFVLHWVDRANIFSAIANIDGCLTNEKDSFLVLGDFLPDAPYRKRYHYRQDYNLYTYKCCYKNTFLSLNTYKTVLEKTYNCDDHNNYGNNYNNCSVSILKKSLDQYYIEL